MLYNLPTYILFAYYHHYHQQYLTGRPGHLPVDDEDRSGDTIGRYAVGAEAVRCVVRTTVAGFGQRVVPLYVEMVHAFPGNLAGFAPSLTLVYSYNMFV